MSRAVPPPEPRPSAEPRGSVLRQDLLAGLINAVVSVPDGLASAALAGVNPVYGLYTSIAAREAGIAPGRSKMPDGRALDAALRALGVDAHAPLARHSDHAADAILTAAWLRRVAGDDALWHPHGLDAVRMTEGWTLGVR